GGDAVAELLRDTADRLGGRPWGVGMVGFVPPERRAGPRPARRPRPGTTGGTSIAARRRPFSAR
ncbi:hypothetical protein, partial [Actinomadura sp. WAC 06369]|uniref:hypothetical protein n=1 Tax=Actinomadura sp. WAC 06369 TaxID=2203193 RepID=UPI001003516B